MKQIEMRHQDGSKITVQRAAAYVERTIEFAKQCGYVDFIVS